ncbi:MAG: SLBB domain-containing protein [Saprospiraceae bacterium]|nr:SLBB domain-containing protein [Saprospiraceae bacterium]
MCPDAYAFRKHDEIYTCDLNHALPMKTLYCFILVVSLVVLNTGLWNLCAQSIPYSESKARQELESRGISEEELRIKLLEKGIDLNSLDQLTAEQALSIQSEIESAIKELEQEKLEKSSRKNIPSAVDKKSNQAGKPIGNKEPGIDDNSGIQKKDSSETPLQSGTNELEIWGHHIFKENRFKVYRFGEDQNPPGNYVLGPGDELTISIWGLSQYNDVFEIQPDGYILPSRMPRIFLKGLSLDRARKLVRDLYKRYYRFQDHQFDLSLNSSRTININVFGEVRQVGGISLPAVNTAFNVLAAAGGPTEIGSVRRIKVIRQGKTSILDVYKFMESPQVEKDFYLDHNDVLQVPVADKVVQITGAVSRPYRYELLENENLNQLLHFAGGLSEDAITKTIQIERIQNDKRVIIDVPFDDLRNKKADFALKKGDKIQVYAIQTKAEELLFVSGEVRAEAGYQFVEGMKISDLISKIDFTSESNLDIAFLKRKNTNGTFSMMRVNLNAVLGGDVKENLMLKAQDELRIYKNSNFVDQAYVSVHGAVRQEGKFNFNPKEDTRVKDLILLSGGLKSDAYNSALLYRKNPNNNKDLEVIRVQLDEIMSTENSGLNIYLKNFDSLVILSQSHFDDALYVEISGAVRNPGRYAYGKGMTLTDLVSLASGYTFFAASNRIDVFRMQVKNGESAKTVVKTISTGIPLQSGPNSSNYELEPFDIIVVRSQPEFRFQQIVQLEGEVKYPGPYALINPNERLSDLVTRAGGLSPEAFPAGATLFRSNDSIGYVVIDLNLALEKVKSHANIILKEGDYIFIPKQKDLVRIAGATNAQDLYPDKLFSNNNAISVAFQEGKSAKYYIDHYAAGISKTGDAQKVTVEHANGRIDRTRNFLFFKVYPKVTKGSVVNVGYKEQKQAKIKSEKKDVDWAKVVADSIAQATAILSLILLIDRID